MNCLPAYFAVVYTLSMNNPNPSSFLNEIAKPTPIAEEADIVVCGGGPAGVAAALGAARMQAQLGQTPNVRLLEVHGQLGGVWTTGLLSWIIDAGNKHGVMSELLEKINAMRAQMGEQPPVKTGCPYDVEQMKLLLEQMCVKAGVKVLLHTRVVGAHVDDQKKLTHVLVENKSGRQAIAGKVFIDCTGDGDLAAQAGCTCEYGRPDPDDPTKIQTQPFSMLCLLTGLERDQSKPYHDRELYDWGTPKENLRAAMRAGGADPSYGKPTLFEIYPDLFTMMANHEYGFSGLNAQDISDATIQSRKEVHDMIAALRKQGGCWSKIRVVATASQIGVRESRRPLGVYTVTLEDMVEGRRFEDAVCRCTFGIDVHATRKTNAGGGIEDKPVGKTQPYDIPYRALVSAEVDGLLFAGRCISGDFFAHSSYRVTGNSVALGEGAGAAAAVAIKEQTQLAALAYGDAVFPELEKMWGLKQV
ncbi:MAG: FAD-dependent oxidoreductase [Phycisphaeraceae bacterium JB051]